MIIFTIIGAIIGAGFASRSGNLFVFLQVWDKRYLWNYYLQHINGVCYIQNTKNSIYKQYRNI